MRALSYLRVSGKSQITRDGFPRQNQSIQSYAQTNGIRIVKTYRDEGISGVKELDDRTGLSDLLAHIQRSRIKIVLVESADRLARDLIVSELILDEFRKLQVEVFDSSGNELTAANGDPTKKLIRQILAAFSEFEKTRLVAKLRAARKRIKQKTGRCEGRKPYGHYHGEQPIVERIKALRANRATYQSIVDTLNAEKVQTRTGKAWTKNTVFQICKR